MSTKISVFGEHQDTRAESTISTSLEPISAAERTDGLPWVDLGVGGWPAERQQNVWETNMRQKSAPLTRKCVKNSYPYAESRCRIEGRPRGVAVGGGQKCTPSSKSASKTRTIRQKVDVELKDARVGWGVEGLKNATP